MTVLRTFAFAQGQRRLATVRADLALRERLDAALGALEPAFLSGLVDRWLRPWEMPPTRPATLAPPLSGVAPLRVGYLPRDRPYSFLNAAGAPDGIAIELMKAAARRAGFTIERFEPHDLKGGLEALRTGRLAMVRDYFAIAYVRRHFPTIEIVPCANYDACLRLVADDGADATLNGFQGTYARLAAFQSGCLAVTGAVTELSDEHNLGLAATRAALAMPLRDALDDARSQDLPAIERQWAAREAQPGIDWGQVQRGIALAAALLLLVLLGWWGHSRRLRREIDRTKTARAESEQYLAFMAHEVRNSLQSVAGAGDTTPSFDLVLSDTRLGDGRVDALLRFMREAVRPGVTMPPVICISADFEPADGERLTAAGAVDLLTKDSDVAAFAARVLRSHADHHGAWAASAPQAFR
jgi:two-component system sensor histidine kinase EvgS